MSPYDASVAITSSRGAEIDPLDFIGLDALLSEEERAIRDMVRQFVTDKVKPYVGEWFEKGEIPLDLIPELAQLGLFGMHLEDYGLPGASSVMYGTLATGEARHVLTTADLAIPDLETRYTRIPAILDPPSSILFGSGFAPVVNPARNSPFKHFYALIF